MAKRSAGLLMYRLREGRREVLLAHPGGPFWAKRDLGAWTMPKGEFLEDEEALAAARREFHEETGFTAQGPFYELGMIRERSGKRVSAWAFEGDADPALLKSNLCQIEWPPRSKRLIDIPEVDRGAWFSVNEAAEYIFPSQLPFLQRLEEVVGQIAS